MSVTAVFLRLGLVLALLAGSGCAWLDTKQRLLIYRPTAGVPADFAGLSTGDERYLLSLPDTDAPQHLAIWWLPNSQKEAPTLLYLHGTFRNLFGNQRKIEALRTAGFSVLAVDYRGWGESSALVPTEESILADAQVAWIELKKRQPDAKKRVIYGHSMGSAVAMDLASRLQSPADYGGLVLESAFTSFDDVASSVGMLGSVLNLFYPDSFDSIGKITRVQAPLLMMHGRDDDTIPIQLGERLFAAASPPKHWLVMENARHSDLDIANPALYQATLQSFAARYLSGQ
ncbi:MAG TPA: alpha/beta fold hydrolase [Rhodoferax sp.]|nr:alpha/beta fold hydrolase [Rhodoferax sp.]